MDKYIYVHICVCVCLNRILLNHRNECNPAICDNMDWLWGIILSKVRQTEKEKYHMIFIHVWVTSLVAQMVKNLPAMQETRVQSLGQDGPLEKGKATHSSILAWKIPWTEQPDGLHTIHRSQSQTRLNKWAPMHAPLPWECQDMILSPSESRLGVSRVV